VGWQQLRLKNSLKFSTSKFAAVIFSAEYHVTHPLKILSEDKQCHLKDEAALSPLESTWRFLDKVLLEQTTKSGSYC
jgi:hypothetical protein